MDRGRKMHASSALAVLLVLGVLPLQTVRAEKTAASCASACAETRDMCKVTACKAGGGHTQLHQGVCYNLPLHSKQTYSAALAKCEAKARVCFSKCN